LRAHHARCAEHITTPTTRKQLDALSAFIGQRREHLLQLWRDSVRHDAQLATCSGLSRGALNDHIPSIID